MDESFQLRAGRLLNGRRKAAALDHGVLRATLAAQQAASPTASAQARAAGKVAGPRDSDPLIELLLVGSRWKEAASDQHGCFNRAESARHRNKR
jgi:hypothetical protein